MNEPPNVDDPEPELLIHITAPTSAKHDLGYRLLAKNTIEFEPATRLLVGSVSWLEEDIALGEGASSLQGQGDNCNESRPAKRRHLDPESLSAVSSQHQAIPWKDFDPEDPHVESGSLTVPDSQSPYDITKSVLLLSSPPIACSTLQPQKRKIEPVSPFTFPSQSPRRSARLQGKSRSFQLSQSSQTSQRSQGKRKKSQTSSPSVEISFSDILSNPNTQTQSSTSSSLPESPYCFTPLNPTATTYTLVHTAPAIPDLPRLNLTPSPPQTQFSPASLTHLLPSTIPPFNTLSPLPTLVPPPYTILCPTPPTSSNPPQFPKQWSTYLERTNYLPRFERLMKTKSRELRSWERGYWRIDLTRWGDAKEKSGFWKMVVGAVEEGRMGLCTVRLEGGSDVEERRGEVRARRLEKKEDGKGDETEDDGEWRFKQDWSREMGGGNVVRVYCYGGAVSYVWAMLYTFSFKRAEGMVWIDSKEEEVLRF
ncbi:hypothetical protein EX30DRAFT_393376 [Ascodesmis nigricans]|uniref:Uncharacterized protein n=1 Tax=Ascodesmis nigricans TaxID=341454 RepID=A0A4V3SJG0_9PEZI|nr:hypothetical protein EX30DRAFT_393376 [Ascodesmis nigricans]